MWAFCELPDPLPVTSSVWTPVDPADPAAAKIGCTMGSSNSTKRPSFDASGEGRLCDVFADGISGSHNLAMGCDGEGPWGRSSPLIGVKITRYFTAYWVKNGSPVNLCYVRSVVTQDVTTL